MEVKPFEKGVIVRPNKEKLERIDGVYSINTNNKLSTMREGVVVKMGEGVDNPDIKEGENVFFRPDAGTELPVNGETLLFLEQIDIKGGFYE